MLETPILQYLEDHDLDLPFCLCWANENWTRHWDGLDNETLIGQQYSSKDDLAFIEYISRYLKDPRYIRISGKPLIIVYRPELFPSPRETAIRWRNWCRENELGEIYLAFTQSFEAADPQEYGFDSAIEFPPNKSFPPVINDQAESLSDKFSGIIFDWSVFPERSEKYKTPEYPLYRGVNPSWDNTPRLKNRATIFVNSSPLGYQKWLYNAIMDTCSRIKEPDNRLLFINAWNEWGEGAYLEPDAKYGYAYLEATRMALLRAEISGSLFDAKRKSKIKEIQQDRPRLAIIIHAFYTDVFQGMLEVLSPIKQLAGVKLFVTTNQEQEDRVSKMLKSFNLPYRLEVVGNHGRDALPFLKIMPAVMSEGYDIFLKLHTKKSTHRKDGEEWKEEIYQKLLQSGQVKKILYLLESQPDIGIIGPEGHIISMACYWGANKEKVLHLANRLGIPEGILINQAFIAGAMFYARVSATLPLLNLALSDEDFEPEEGQVDGTMAHALERAFTISALSVNMKLLDSSCASKLQTFLRQKIRYRYAVKSHY